MSKKSTIKELELIAKHNHHVNGLLELYKGGHKSLDQVMIEMISIMAFEAQELKESLNKEKQKTEIINSFIEKMANSKLPDPELAQLIAENFWDLV